MAEGIEDGLNERAQQLLKALIENYIRDGQPVGLVADRVLEQIRKHLAS